MALVSQEPMLFNGTVAENVRFGSPHATDAQVAPHKMLITLNIRHKAHHPKH